MQNHTILIVDDEPSIIATLSRSLDSPRLKIHAADSGEGGLRTLARHDVDLVISDLNMPGMGGMAFLKKVQLDHPHVLAIVLTAHGDLAAAMEAINTAGVYKFLLKPWHEDALRMTVQRALEAQRVIMERDRLIHKVKRQEAILNELEQLHPGITKKNVDEHGCIVIS